MIIKETILQNVTFASVISFYPFHIAKIQNKTPNKEFWALIKLNKYVKCYLFFFPIKLHHDGGIIYLRYSRYKVIIIEILQQEMI